MPQNTNLAFFNIVQKEGGGVKPMLENCRFRNGLTNALVKAKKISTKCLEGRGGAGGGGSKAF